LYHVASTSSATAAFRSATAPILSVAEPAEATFSKYYEILVTINENIRLYCETTRKR